MIVLKNVGPAIKEKLHKLSAAWYKNPLHVLKEQH